MKAHELAAKLLAGPDIPVIFIENREDCTLVWEVDELVQHDKKPSYYEITTAVEAPFLELQ